jgi:hypothetical protein
MVKFELKEAQDLHPTLGLPEGSIVKVSEASETFCAGHVGFIVRQSLDETSAEENEWGFSSFNSVNGVCYEIPYEDFEALKYFDRRFYRLRVVQGEYINDLD